jgi:hypothetical protein
MSESIQERRIFREYIFFKKIYNNIVIDIENDKIILIFNNPKTDYDSYPHVKFVLKNYPFKSPKIFIYPGSQEVNYLDWRKYCDLPRIVEAMKIINKTGCTKDIPRKKKLDKSCFCCDSILCNWTPTAILEKIINEIMMTNQIKKQVKIILELNKICKKNKLSNDIEIEICSYLL